MKKLTLLFYALLFITVLIDYSCKKDDDDNKSEVTDIDGNVYNTVTIGTQVWMKENLKTTKYNDGTPIPLVSDSATWKNLKTPGYCWYDNNQATYGDTYGALYNWYAVETGNLCPTGWYVPSDSEWIILSDYLINNGHGYEGSGSDIAKSMASTFGWDLSNEPGDVGNDQASNNSSGFTAVPGAIRRRDGSFYGIGQGCNFWSSNEEDRYNAGYGQLFYTSSHFLINNLYKEFGFSVRCVKDE